MLLALTLLLRWQQDPVEPEPIATARPALTATPRPITVETPPQPSPSPTVAPDPYTPQGYTAETYQLVSELVFTRRSLGAEGDEQIQTVLASLREAYPG